MDLKFGFKKGKHDTLKHSDPVDFGDVGKLLPEIAKAFIKFWLRSKSAIFRYSGELSVVS